MPRVPDEFLECVVYVYESVEDARGARRGGGTGFLVQWLVDDTVNLAVNYVVTNSHVAKKAEAIRVNTIDGGNNVISISPEQWIHHQAGDDIAIAPIGLSPDRFRYKVLPARFFLNKAEIEELNVGPGDDVYFMGRFVTLDGKQRNQPVVRFGSIAMMPGEPIHQKDREFDQESFLIEARSWSGFSGSPVMLHIPPFSNRFKTGKFEADDHGLRAETTTALLGIHWGSICLGGGLVTNTGFIAVVPVWKLSELLDSSEVVDRRRGLAEAVD
ncbi:MAG TPA: trypsin-like peptidase domain-containing protein [Mycobacteriales bacterium]|jgi:hypothetical protein|nr:trypsin-like peptidase domain-containing protein [Mycobacteriales bacterium]